MEKLQKNGMNESCGVESRIARKKGFTLVEVLVAMFIGLIIAAMLFLTLERQSKTHIAHTEISEIQERNMSIMDLVSAEIRMAGYMVGDNRVWVAQENEFSFSADISDATFNAGGDAFEQFHKNSGIDTQYKVITYRFTPPTKPMSDTSVPEWHRKSTTEG